MPKNYSSAPELSLVDTWSPLPLLRRSRSLSDVHARRGTRQRGKAQALQRQHSIPETGRTPHSEKNRDRSATPDLSGPAVIKQDGSDIYAETVPVSGKNSRTSSCPPPSYPPPPPPVGQVVKVEVGRGEYADLTTGRPHKSAAVMSSFRPTDSAKLYASPDAFVTVGYKKEHLKNCDVTLPRHMTKGSGSRSQSLPPKMPNASNSTSAPGSSSASLDNDNSSGDSGYTPFKSRSRDASGNEIGPTDRRSSTLRKVKQQGNKLDSSSPKHYPALPQEPDYDSSEEDTTPGLDAKSGLVTFKAIDNDLQKALPDIPKDTDDTAKPKQETNANMTLRKKRLKSQSSVESSKLSSETEDQTNVTKHVVVEKTKSLGESEVSDAGILQSEETGERIFLQNDQPTEQANDSSEKSGASKKIAPVPPPKRTEEKSKDASDVKAEKESSAKAIREAFEKQMSEIPDQDMSKSSAKEPIAFKATIVLKQTEVVTKDVKDVPFRIKNKELIHQHSAHELMQVKNKEDTRKDANDDNEREKLVKSPSQGFREKIHDTVDASQRNVIPQNDLKERTSESNNSQKIAPAVPKKPKVEEVKPLEDATDNVDALKSLQVDSINVEQGNTSPIIDAASRSVRENIYNFEKRSTELSTSKGNVSPRRKSDVIRITLIGCQQKLNEAEKNGAVNTMKTSKSCPRTFEEDIDLDVENTFTAAMLHSDAHNQVTRFSAETPTTTLASTNFCDEWRRTDVVSPVNIPYHVENIKKPPDTPPKNTHVRRGDNFSKTQTLGRKLDRELEFQDTETTHFSETMTLNRQTLAKSDAAKFQQHPDSLHRDHPHTRVPVLPTTTASPPSTMLPPTSHNHPGQFRNIPPGAYIQNVSTPSGIESIHYPANIPLELSQKLTHEHLTNIRNRESFEDPHVLVPQTKAGPMSAQARLLDHRHIKMAAPTPNRAPPPKNRDDDECLKLCQRVDKSLQLIRLQVDSLRMAAASEPEVLAELVPPPPEFNFAGQMAPPPPPHQMQPLHIAPPPEFSDESLARQRRAQQNMISTMDAPISRRVVPPDTANYPYPEHLYRGYHPMQSPQDHHTHHPMHHHGLPNNLTSSPTKTMTMTRSGYHAHPSHAQPRHESNCNTLPHPRIMLPPQSHHHPQPQQPPMQQQHPFSPGRTNRETPRMMGPIPPIPQHKEFRQKPLHQWNMKDVSDWLESLFLPEYKITFAEAGITGSKLANMDNNDLMGLGVKQAGHRLNMERSIKWYLK